MSFLSDIRKVPNLITLSRILLLAPVLYLIVRAQFYYALLVYVIGAYTDVLDGNYARKRDQVTRLGKALDPFADKIFYLPPIYFAGIPETLFFWWWSLVGLEIFLIILGAMAFFKREAKVELGANQWGKLKARSEVIFAITVFVDKFDWAPDIPMFMLFSLASAIMFALMSIFGHLGIFNRIK